MLNSFSSSSLLWEEIRIYSRWYAVPEIAVIWAAVWLFSIPGLIGLKSWLTESLSFVQTCFVRVSKRIWQWCSFWRSSGEEPDSSHSPERVFRIALSHMDLLWLFWGLRATCHRCPFGHWTGQNRKEARGERETNTKRFCVILFYMQIPAALVSLDFSGLLSSIFSIFPSAARGKAIGFLQRMLENNYPTFQVQSLFKAFCECLFSWS